MPVYTPKFNETVFKGGKNILASEHFQFIEAGGTLDATAFDTGYHESGTLVARNTTTGKFEPYEEDTTGGGAAVPSGYDNFAITNVDFENDGVHDMIIGELIVRGSVYEEKLASAVPATFKEANPLIRYVTHV